MNMPKPSEEDRRRFHDLVPDDPRVEVKPMFGNLGAFVNGNMFLGLFGSAVGVKLDEPDQAALLAEPGAGPFGPETRPMGGYVTLPPGWAEPQARRWIERSLEHVGALPPKTAKTPKSPKTPKPPPRG